MDASEITAWAAGAAGVITAVVAGLVSWSKQKSSESTDSHSHACEVLKNRLTVTENRLDVTQAMVMECEQKHGETKSVLAGLKVMAEDCFKDRTQLHEDRKLLNERIKRLEDTVIIK